MRGKKAKALLFRKSEIQSRRRAGGIRKTNERMKAYATGDLDMFGNPVVVHMPTYVGVANKNAFYKRHKKGV